ncbi:hypothetical protein LMG18102_03229 [Ralstonia mannitolilytica]|uniref:hypothetical protein n=1 Tax=Ralstonia mannitolilytica TaxID=105219 RepID=UPI0028F58CD4|nr:hypothetical protein [Ralstonia mannitolilytica]CAJ0700479.1 hypothetical protein LMG18102_03229 [Ralstonia mannitolilytica]
MKAFLVRIAAGGRRLSFHTIAASSTDALMLVMGSLETVGMPASSGSARLIGRTA